MAVWRRTHRIPSLRDIVIIFVLLVLLNYFRTWDIYYATSSSSSSSSRAYTQSLETPQAQVNTPTIPHVQTPAESTIEITEEIPFEVSDTQMPVSGPGPSRIPKKIWYKLGAKGLSYDARSWTSTCITQNPGYHAEFLTDQSADDFVRGKYADRPDIVGTYMALTIPILKAYLLRYLLLYAEGGVWFDLDVSCEGIPIDEWVPEEFRDDISLVVGWEFDAGYEFLFERQFTTWTVMAQKGVPHLMAVVEDIVKSVSDLARANNATISQLKLEMVGDVVEVTGPRRFAKSVTQSVGASLNETGHWNGWDDYYNILEPKLAGDVLILPGYSWADLFNTYREEDQEKLGPSLVVHHYAGSWKNEYGGERAQDRKK